MATALDVQQPAHSTTPTSGAPDRHAPIPAAAALLGVCLAIVVGRDGSPAWQVLRSLVVLAITVGVVAIVSLQRRCASGLAACTWGIVGIAVGIGIGVPHVVKGGAVAAAAGVIALASGLVLLIGGAARLVRASRGWRKPAVAVAALLVAVPLVCAVSIAVAATNVPRTSLGTETPDDHGLSYRDVEFAATDGVPLSGWYIPGVNGAAIVLARGAGSTRSAVLDHAVVFARHGYGVLLFDARGHGRSGGRAMDFGWYGDEDVGGAVSFLAAQPEVQAIGAVGMSMGGEQVIGAAASDPRIRVVVAEGATNRVLADRAWLRDEYGLRGWLQLPVDWLTFAAADVLTDADPPSALRDAVAATAAPVLLIAAGDVGSEERAGRGIASGSPSTVEMWVVPSTGHTDALRTHPDEWEARVTEFLTDALGLPPQ